MPWSPPDPRSYSYLLGVYLGDGCVTGSGHSRQLVIACDSGYPGLVDDIWAAVVLTLLAKRVACHPHRMHRCTRVVASSKRWTEAFPQHGPGR